MSLRAPYSLVQEPTAAVESYVSTNPFLPLEEQRGSAAATNFGGAGGAEQRQPIATEMNKIEHYSTSQQGNVTEGRNSYVPPETVFMKTGTDETKSAGTNLERPSYSGGVQVDGTTNSMLSIAGDRHDRAEKPQKGILKRTSLTTENTVNHDTRTKVQHQQSIVSASAGRSSMNLVKDSRSSHTVRGESETLLEKVDSDSPESDTAAETDSTTTLDDFKHSSNKHSKSKSDQTDRQVLIELEEDLDDDDGDRPRRSQRPPPQRRRLQKLQSQLNLSALAQNELELKANLFYHIGNPIKRWRVEKIVPWKLVLQLLKTFCLLVQVVLYTSTFPRHRAMFFYESREVFENLFFKNYVQDNPRDMYSAFNAEEILEQFDYTVDRYCALPNITIGGYDFAFDEQHNIIPASMKLLQYAEARFDTFNDTFLLNGTIITKVFNVPCGENASERYVSESNDRLFNRFVELVISFPIKNMRVIHPEKVECYLFEISIHFTVEESSGKVTYYLQEDSSRISCQGEVLTMKRTFYILYGALTVLDIIVVLLCTMSIYLTCTSLQRACKLYKAMGVFYEQQLNIKLSWWERRALFPIWHAVNTLSDLLIIVGSICKILLDFFVLDNSAPVRVLLGTAVLCQAMVMLRYISYFKQLNALTRTMYLAFPELLKFLLCSGILFIAFALTGWIVLGPFLRKFETMNSAIEALFGLLNGDDIYATFTQIRPQDDSTAYIYSRIFLYIFLALFIYAVLNLFTSLIITAYEASQDWDTATRNEVRRFVFSGPLTSNGVALRDFSLTKKYVDPKLIKERKRSSLKKRISYRLRSRADTIL